jgi:acyl-CoA thioesterase-1
MTRSLVLCFALLPALLAGACSVQAPSGDTEPARPGEEAAAPAPTVPDDRPVVVFLGTSLTAGLGLDRDEDTYVTRVAELADSAGTPIRAVNAGVSGETSAGGLRRLDWILREPLDVLVVELGANDGLRGQNPFALQENLTEIVRRTRTRYPEAKIVLAGMEAPPNLGQLYTTAFHQVFPAVAEAEQTLLVPFLLDGVAGVPALNQSDGIHPTPEGHRIMARHVWSVLGPVVGTVAASR